MPLKVGDKVRFLNDIGGGEIVSMLDGRTAMVRNQDGFDIPTLLTELIEDRPFMPESRPAARSAYRPEPAAAPAVAPPVRTDPNLALMSVGMPTQALLLGIAARDWNDTLRGPYDLYVINDFPQSAYITLGAWEQQHIRTFFAGKVKPKSARLAITVEPDELFEFALVQVQALFYDAEPHHPCPPVAINIEVKRGKFARPGAFQKNRYLETPLYLIAVHDRQKESLPSGASLEEGMATETLTPEQREALLAHLGREDLQKVAEGKEKAEEKKVSVPNHLNEEVVIDLHMEALIHHPVSMEPHEMLEFQLSHFKKAMEHALADGQVKRLIAIHGVGNGRLRNAVLATLRSDYPGCQWQDASFREYGWGATLVFIHRGQGQ